MKKMLLIDGNSLMFRAYHATSYTGNLMQSRSGVYTNALFGFAMMMQKALSIDGVTHMFVAFDSKEKTFRHLEFEGYKGTRKAAPDELIMQIPLIKEYLDILGVKRLEVPGFEADDLIGTMACQAYDDIDQILVFSGDHDLLQLVNDKTSVILTIKGMTELEEYNKDNFIEKMGFTPKQMIDYKGMIGDASDNLPGIRGVGPKTAVKLLNEYHTLENVIANIDNLTGKLKELVQNDRDIALKTKYLATIKCDSDLNLNLEATEYHGYDLNNLIKFYESVDFYSFIDKLDKPLTPEAREDFFIHLNDTGKFRQEKIQKAYLSLELTRENYHKAEIIGLGVFTDSGESFFFDAEHIPNKDVKTFLETEHISKKVMDLKRLYVALSYQDILVKGFDFDLLLAAYVINPSFASYSMSTLANNFMKTNLAFDDAVIGKKGKVESDIDTIAKHSLEKCRTIKALEDKLMEKIKANNQLSLYQDIEIPLSVILGDIELNGFMIDRKELVKIGQEFDRNVNELGNKIFELCGEIFNISSPLQLGKILFEKMNLPHGKKTKTGYSTSVDILEKLAPDYEVVRLILNYRKFSKLSSTYITGLQEEMFPDSKVHTMFKQALTLTGRLSSVEPNIQNIPIRTEDGKIIREAFVPSFKGGYIVSADYSQIELRLLAHMAKVPEMIKAFNNEADFHTLTAAKMYGIRPEEVTPVLRRSAKAVNFGIIYGMSDWGLSETLGINPAEANQFIKKYFEAYPEIRVFLDKTVQEAKENGYTKTLFERRRYIPELANANYQLEQFGERTAMNAPLQGSAADIIKKAMIDVDKALKDANLKSKIVAQIHDELVLDVPAEELEQIKVLVEKAMEETVRLDVLLRADVEYGPNWNIK